MIHTTDDSSRLFRLENFAIGYIASHIERRDGLSTHEATARARAIVEAV